MKKINQVAITACCLYAILQLLAIAGLIAVDVINFADAAMRMLYAIIWGSVAFLFVKRSKQLWPAAAVVLHLIFINIPLIFGPSISAFNFGVILIGLVLFISIGIACFKYGTPPEKIGFRFLGAGLFLSIVIQLIAPIITILIERPFIPDNNFRSTFLVLTSLILFIHLQVYRSEKNGRTLQ